MVKFSVAEGKEEKRRKLLCAAAAASVCFPFEGQGEDEDDDNDNDVEKEAARAGDGGRPELCCEGGGSSSSSERINGSKEAVTVSIDPDALDCPICCETLSPPILQCRNGHIACSNCCTKMKKCHSCLCPIGPSRCLALENVIESIKVSCPYASNGCGERVSYVQRNTHKETCIYSPCVCPISGCTFTGSLQQLSHHFSSSHGDHAIFFLYNLPLKLSMDENEPFRVLLGEDGVLFLLLNNSGVPVGNAVTMTCIGPNTLKGDFSYQLIARSKESSIQIESSVTNIKRWDGVFPSKDFLLIPRGFCGMSGKLSLDVCVRNKRQ